MRSRRYMVLACMLLMIGILCGCKKQQSENIVLNQSKETKTSQAELTFFGFKYEALNVKAIENALHSFMEKNPDITISYDGIKSPAYFDVLEKRLNTGNGDDIIMVDHAWALELEKQNRLADLSDLSTLDQFSDLAKSQMSINGKISYLPTSISAFGLYCNLDLLKEHGQAVPENLSELEAVCDYFVSKGITPIVANNDISLKTIIIAKGMLPYYQQENSVQVISQFNKKKADLVDALKPGFELVEQMLESGWVNREEALKTKKTEDDLTIFAKGKQPFMLTGAWAVPRLRDLKPTFEFEVKPYPIFEDGSVLVVNVDTRLSVLADSSHLKESKQFVEYLTKPDVIWEFVNSQCSFSPLRENRLADDKAIQSIGSYLTNGRSVIGSDDNINLPIWDITRESVVGMLKGDDATTAVTNMNNMIKEWSSTEEGGDAN